MKKEKTKGRYSYDDTDGKHCHMIGGVPLLGTSTVVGVISKPLSFWASSEAVKTLGWIKPLNPRDKPSAQDKAANDLARLNRAHEMLQKFPVMTPAEYMALLDKAYRAHADSLDKSADKGTEMHLRLQQFVEACIVKNEGKPLPIDKDASPEWEKVKLFSEWAQENVAKFIASEAHCYSEVLFVGGITDCICELKNGQRAIIDFKSSKEAYRSQFCQVAGYHTELLENGLVKANGDLIGMLDKDVDCYIIFPFGMVEMKPQYEYDTLAMRKGFAACVVLYKLMNEQKINKK